MLPLVSSQSSLNGTTPEPVIAMSPEVQRSPVPWVRTQPLFGQFPPNAVMTTDEAASAPTSMWAAIRMRTFVTPTGTVATDPVLSHITTPLPSVLPLASGTVKAGSGTPVAESVQPLSAAPVESSTKVAIPATGLTSGTLIGSDPRELVSLRISTRAWALIAGRNLIVRNLGTTPRNSGRSPSVALTSTIFAVQAGASTVSS